MEFMADGLLVLLRVFPEGARPDEGEVHLFTAWAMLLFKGTLHFIWR